MIQYTYYTDTEQYVYINIYILFPAFVLYLLYSIKSFQINLRIYIKYRVPWYNARSRLQKHCILYTRTLEPMYVYFRDVDSSWIE